MRNCLLLVKDEDVSFGTEEDQFQSQATQRTQRVKAKAFPLNEPALRGMVSLVKRIPKENTCPRGKRQLLILVLSEISSVSFYQRVMETQSREEKEKRINSTESQVSEHTIKVYSNLSCYIHADVNKNKLREERITLIR